MGGCAGGAGRLHNPLLWKTDFVGRRQLTSVLSSCREWRLFFIIAERIVTMNVTAARWHSPKSRMGDQ